MGKKKESSMHLVIAMANNIKKTHKAFSFYNETECGVDIVDIDWCRYYLGKAIFSQIQVKEDGQFTHSTIF